jgi:hypothetical protein
MNNSLLLISTFNYFIFISLKQHHFKHQNIIIILFQLKSFQEEFLILSNRENDELKKL